MSLGAFLTIIVFLYLIVDIISYLPWGKIFYKEFFYKPKEKYLITIDDAPSENIFKMLELLEKYEMKAIFFVNGEKVSGYEELVKLMVLKGHKIGNHSYKHYFFNPIVKDVIVYDLERNDELLKELGIETDYIRTPHGYQTPGLFSYIKENNKKFFYWDIMLFDFVPFIPNFILKKQIDKFIVKGGILCMHERKKSLQVFEYLLHSIDKKEQKV